MKFVGIDGCHGGWFVVSLNDNQDWDCAIYSNIDKIWEQYRSSMLILIDIPIGLPFDKNRSCDVETRRLLKKWTSSVFPAPSREAIHEQSYEIACQTNIKIIGKKMSKQLWHISHKIKEVDELLNQKK